MGYQMLTHLFSPLNDIQRVGEGHPSAYLTNYIVSYTCCIKIFPCSVDPQHKKLHGAISCFFGSLDCYYMYIYLNLF